MIVGEPKMLNPNSFENLATILRSLGRHANIKAYSNDDNARKRKWLFIEDDGGIPIPALKLIYNVHKCSKCNESIYGIKNFDDHLCVGAYSLTAEYEFDWLTPQSGLLHFEMNAGKSFMSLCWNVFMKETCRELEFQSENALKHIRKGSDHHELWDILQIAYISFTDELLIPFIRHCNLQNIEPTVNKYWNYSSNIKNLNYIFIPQIVLTFLQPR